MRFWNVPNTIGVIRTLVIPIAIIMLYYNFYAYVGISLIILSYLLDAVDGYLARKLNQTTTIGSLVDVLADRITEYILWIFFTYMKYIPLWAPLIVIPRGVLTDAIRSIASAKGISVYDLPKNSISKLLVRSRLFRVLIGLGKLVSFTYAGYLMAIGRPTDVYVFWLVVFVVVINIARGLPVIIESGPVVLDRSSK